MCTLVATAARMPESFGARLRQRREEQQIALSAIAEQIKIKSSLLEALERDDVSHWPWTSSADPGSARTPPRSASMRMRRCESLSRAIRILR